MGWGTGLRAQGGGLRVWGQLRRERNRLPKAPRPSSDWDPPFPYPERCPSATLRMQGWRRDHPAPCSRGSASSRLPPHLGMRNPDVVASGSRRVGACGALLWPRDSDLGPDPSHQSRPLLGGKGGQGFLGVWETHRRRRLPGPVGEARRLWCDRGQGASSHLRLSSEAPSSPSHTQRTPVSVQRHLPRGPPGGWDPGTGGVPERQGRGEPGSLP